MKKITLLVICILFIASLLGCASSAAPTRIAFQYSYDMFTISTSDFESVQRISELSSFPAGRAYKESLKRFTIEEIESDSFEATTSEFHIFMLESGISPDIASDIQQRLGRYGWYLVSGELEPGIVTVIYFDRL